jgi:hypothetical protein
MNAIPVCPPDNGSVILFPKPENCSEFYQCAGGVAHTHHCPENLYYCEEKQYCAWINEQGCKFDCVITETNPAPAAEEFVPAAAPECPPQTGDDVTYLPNPDNCNEYYECSNEVPVLMQCPDDLFFCTEKQTCDWVEDPQCSYNCVVVTSRPVIVEKDLVPECPPQTDNLTLIANPNNCSSFYECDNGIPVPMGCPEGLHFCSEKSICSWPNDPDCTFDCDDVDSNPVLVKEKFVPAAAPECPPQTGGDVTYLPNPDNCNEYYECSNEVPVLMQCPDDLFFCTEKNTCDWVEDPQCSYNCVVVTSRPVIVEEDLVPECPPQTENLTLIANPNNCSEFYQCDNGIPVPVGCSEGLHFCSEKSICSWPNDPDCTFDCIDVDRDPVLVEKKFDAIHKRAAEPTSVKILSNDHY